MAESLQEQGVPVPSRLRGDVIEPTSVRSPSASHATRRTVQTRTANASPTRNAARSRRPARRARNYSPVAVGANAAKSTGISGGNPVGTLEAEFLIGLALLILLMFSSQASYSDKIMSVMKRGALMCILFFILALVSSNGPNAAKIAKAFGALVIVGIVVTSPVDKVVTDLDNLVKNDWVGTGETNKDATAPSAASGTQASTGSFGSDFIHELENLLKIRGGNQQPANPTTKSGLLQDAKNALNSTLNGIIPGSGDILSKFGL